MRRFERNPSHSRYLGPPPPPNLTGAPRRSLCARHPTHPATGPLILTMTQINDKIATRVDGDIGFIVSDNPPVNALGIGVRQGIAGALEKLRAAPAVKAIVLYCIGRTFFAGADITEFGKPRQSPALQDVIAALESSAKPVIAAIHGTALGGGFETALGCAFRVAIPSARVGLPEVNLGLFAGGGGTQRLPRPIGPEQALGPCPSGKPL